MSIDWGRMLYEVRQKIAERTQGQDGEMLEGARCTMHPEDYRDLVRAVDMRVLTYMHHPGFPTYMGFKLRPSAVVTPGWAMLTQRNGNFFGMVNLYENQMQIGDLEDLE